LEIVNYGIIGCGMMGREHIENIKLLPQGRVAAVYDPVAELAESAATLAGDATVCPSLEALLAHDPLDAVVIVSPNHCHLDQLDRIAAARPLPILCEKPLYTRAEDLTRVETLAARHPAPIWVAMEYRYMPPIAALIAQAEQTTGGIAMLTIREHRFPFLPKIGDWNRFNANTGGTLVEKCCHFFDLMRHILRDEPVRVFASGAQDVNHLDELYDGKVPDILDNAFVVVDEAQNCTYAQLKMLLTRLGWNSTMVVTGDPAQTDLLPDMSGLKDISEKLERVNDVSVIRLDQSDIVRHPLVASMLDVL